MPRGVPYTKTQRFFIFYTSLLKTSHQEAWNYFLIFEIEAYNYTMELPITLNQARFLALLTKLVGESGFLQNNPAQGLIPREDRASQHVLEALKPYMKENGGVLEVERVTFVEGRGSFFFHLFLQANHF